MKQVNQTQGRNMTETQRKSLQAAEDAFRRYADHRRAKGRAAFRASRLSARLGGTR